MREQQEGSDDLLPRALRRVYPSGVRYHVILFHIFNIPLLHSSRSIAGLVGELNTAFTPLFAHSILSISGSHFRRETHKKTL